MKAYLGYHRTHTNGPFSGNSFFTGKSVTANSLLYVVSGHEMGPRMPKQFRLEGKFLIRNVNDNRGSTYTEKATHLQLEPLAVPVNSIDLDALPDFDHEWFRNKFASGQGMVELSDERQDIQPLFDELLPSTNDRFADETLVDLKQIEDDHTLTETERMELRKARVGQGRFRKNVIESWGGEEKCAVTGIAIPAFLNASHVLPWSESTNTQRLSGTNGILLCVHLDRLFDRNLISFQPGKEPDYYDLAVSPRLKDFAALRSVGVDRTLRLNLAPLRFSERDSVMQHLRGHLKKTSAASAT